MKNCIETSYSRHPKDAKDRSLCHSFRVFSRHQQRANCVISPAISFTPQFRILSPPFLYRNMNRPIITTLNHSAQSFSSSLKASADGDSLQCTYAIFTFANLSASLSVSRSRFRHKGSWAFHSSGDSLLWIIENVPINVGLH